MQLKAFCESAALLLASMMLMPCSHAADGLDSLLQRAETAAADEGDGVAAPNARRLPIPSAEARRRSASKVNEIFGADAKGATAPEAKSKLAASLFDHAKDTPDPTDRYVLLDASRSLAAESGDIDTAFKAISELAAHYQVDGDASRLEVLETAAAKSPPAAIARIVPALLQLSSRSKDGSDLESAEKAAQLAAAAARRSKDRDLQKTVQEELADIRERKKVAAKLQPLLDKVSADPSDREAAADLGRFRCFVEDNWAAGLPFLAKGSDDDLAPIARAELTEPKTPAARIQLGDAWWAFASNHKGPEAAAAEARARIHYGAALSDLEGLEKARVQKRLETSVTGGKTPAKRPRNLVLWLDASAPGSLRGPDGQVFDKSQAKEMKIAEWIDVAGGRAIAKQTNPSRFPTARANAFGKNPALSFDGNSILIVRMPPPPTGTIVVVCRGTSTNTVMHMIGTSDQKPGIRISSRLKGEVNLQVVQNNATSEVCESAGGVFAATKTAIISGNWPSPFIIRVNGQPFAHASAAKLNASAGDAIIMGAMHDGGAFPFVGDVAEIRLYDRVLQNGEIANLEAELTGKWAASR